MGGLRSELYEGCGAVQKRFYTLSIWSVMKASQAVRFVDGLVASNFR